MSHQVRRHWIIRVGVQTRPFLGANARLDTVQRFACNARSEQRGFATIMISAVILAGGGCVLELDTVFGDELHEFPRWVELPQAANVPEQASCAFYLSPLTLHLSPSSVCVFA